LTRQTSETVSTEGLESESIPVSGDSEHRGGYDPFFFDRLARIEDRHFWFRARNELIQGLAARISSSLKPCDMVLEIGCGTGNVLRVLEKAFPKCRLVGLELWLDGLRHARSRSGACLVQADIRNSPFGKQFDLVGMFDVLEHIAEDRETLTLVHHALRPGGKLLLTVPAHQWLWSYFDEAAHHCRRYSADGIRRKLEEAGFEVEVLTQFMACLLPLVWAYRKLAALRKNASSAQQKASDEFRLVPAVNGILAGLLRLEAKWICRGHVLPIGTSLVVVARKAA
jgi:SAM-dependent methyltransferase